MAHIGMLTSAAALLHGARHAFAWGTTSIVAHTSLLLIQHRSPPSSYLCAGNRAQTRATAQIIISNGQVPDELLLLVAVLSLSGAIAVVGCCSRQLTLSDAAAADVAYCCFWCQLPLH